MIEAQNKIADMDLMRATSYYVITQQKKGLESSINPIMRTPP
jgi:hypothetical protein